MKGSMVKKIVLVAIVALLLVATTQLGAVTSYADGSSFTNYPLSEDYGVKASYDSSSKVLTITGAGTIKYDNWVMMAKQINDEYYQDSDWLGGIGWDFEISEDDMKIVFSGGSKAIKLCSAENNGLFSNFSGQIEFNGAVDLSPDADSLSRMFYYATQFNEPVDWDTSNVAWMRSVFSGATSFNQPVNWDTSNAVVMDSMFEDATSFNQPVNFNTSRVSEMANMFCNATSFNQPVNFDMSKVHYMRGMFKNTTSFQQAVNFNISSLEYAKKMFENSAATAVVLSGQGNQQDIDAKDIFKSCNNLKYLEFSDLKDANLTGFSGDYYVVKDGAAPIAKTASSSYDFDDNATYRVYLQSANVEDISSCTITAPDRQVYTGFPLTPDCYLTYEEMVELERGDDYILRYEDNIKLGQATVVISGIDDYYGEETVNFDIVFPLSDDGNVVAGFGAGASELLISGYGQINRDKWIGMARSFSRDNFNESYGWKNEENFDISFVSNPNGKIELPTDSSALFQGFDGQIHFNDAVDTAAVTNMSRMFAGARSFNQPINFDTSNVTNMSFMFTGASIFNQPVAFDTSKVVDMSGMFAEATNFNKAVNFDTENVENMNIMFMKTDNFNQPIDFDISSAEELLNMFFSSAVERVLLRNDSAHSAILADGIFSDTNNLRELEFSGLMNANLPSFSGDYYVEENGGSPIAKQADEGYTFTDNLHYKVYLQSEAPLAAPTVSLSKVGSAIKVAWPAVADATGYQVFRADAAAGPYTLFKTTTGLSYTNAGALVPGMPYFYKVRAYRNASGSYTFSDYSAVKGIYAPGALAKPAAPSLTLDENAGGIRLNWNAQPRITGYQIFRGVSTDKPFSYLKTTSGLAQVYTNISGLSPGRPYYYKIRAYRTADGVTKYGDFSTIKGLFAGTNEPALKAVNFNLSDNNAVSVPNVRVTWSGVSGADGYCVYRWDSVHKTWIGLKATGPNARVYTNINGVVSGKTFFYGMRPLHISGGTTYYGNIGQAKGYKVP